MQWNKNDIIQFQEAAEYIDNLVIPLLPISLKSEKKTEQLAFQGELMDIFTNEIERNYKGRIFLMPSYNYISSNPAVEEWTRLNEWVDHALHNPFKYVFFLTFDPQWKQVESKLNGNLLWFPALQTGDLQAEESKIIIKDHINQLSELIKTYWNTK